MRITFPETLILKIGQVRSQPWPTERIVRWVGLSAIVVLAGVLRFSDLNLLGYINHYYAAAIVSMLKSWHNFFFVAAEPGGLVSVDKPPVGLWIQTASAFIFGVNTFGLLLPEILAGILSVVVIYHLVQRSFGTMAGLLSALALAITPVVVATDRNNTMDSLLILTMLLAAWAFIKATETSRLRYLLLGASLVGIGFNIKMLEAYLPLPAFYVLYFLGCKDGFWRKIGKLALASFLLLVISFSWIVIVDLTPANLRPYVGSSGDNSEMSLALGYNGIERLLGMGRTSLAGSGGAGPGGFPQPGFGGNGNRSFGGPAGRQPGNPGFTGGGANSGIGLAGPLRLFTAPLSKEVSWLLPIALFGAILLLFRERIRWPITAKHQALALWWIWLLTDATFFSVAGFFHEYYLSMMAGPLVVLVGIAMIELWHLFESKRWLALILLLSIVGITLAFQISIASAFIKQIWWQPVMIALFILGGAVLILTASFKLSRTAIAGFSIMIAAVLISLVIWSGLTVLNPSSNQSLPAAYNGQSSGLANSGGLTINQALLNYLEANTQKITYLMAVPSSMQGSDYVIATGRPVLYLGGFMGVDQVVDSSQLAQMVTNNELRFIYWDPRGNGFGGQLTNESDLSSWINQNCKVVNGYETATQNSGAPGGTTSNNQPGTSVRGFGGFGEMQITLYDCGK